jgi:hypothetical protein
MALGKFLAKKTSVLYCIWLRDEFVDLYVETVVGYNGPCTWDSVVQNGMKKEDFVQLYKQTPKYMVITMFRISGVARFSFCREERVIKMAAPNRSHEVLKKSQLCVEFPFICLGGLKLTSSEDHNFYSKYWLVPAFGRPARPRHSPPNYPSCGPDQNADPHAVWKRKQHSECNEVICLAL